VVSAALLLGCTPAQLKTGDRIAADANSVGTTVQAVASNPLVPEPFSTIGLLIATVLTGTYAGWQRVRASGLLEKNQTLTQTAKAIVRAIDTAAPATATEIKGLVAGEMARKDITTIGKATVEELKVA
jgi:hypothetical protein